ncbi:Arm DNA-binding domain-containing protein [Sphingomonas cynarae]|uniref:Arm DNA-binding domain-containing protein n=1 Tax=Sphingomonas cynarae TaxID=930197 RepID=UPI003CD06615
MARSINRLTALDVKNEKRPGLHADGGGLYLSTTNGGRRWVFLYRWEGKRREMGLGATGDVPLVRARQLAAQARQQV